MHTVKVWTMGFASACLVISASAQGTFQNLDFEAANVPVIPTNQFGADVAVSNGIPGWTAYIGGGAVATIFHNNQSLGAAAIAILGPQWYGPQILQGNYTVLIGGSSAGPPTTAAVGQTGQVPSDAQSLRFFGDPFNDISASFAGNPISLAQASNSGNYAIWVGDISGFAGQTGDLRFTASAGGGGLLDNIFFSTQPAPEPSTFVLLIFGAVLLGWPSLLKRCQPRK